ncbi:hypothetical protein LZ009_21945 [Ramlibacter sp. XY19]|uniref:hypothetical protein n=1 Tax=Ramlibacter paludis TaxID=2908000 RepID=UPI0023DB04EC|nr:hypothetical protein [Ramlibacter paludis]MCG2595449.1 hypothetical protein [Ramlibacter paludis]
MTTHAAEAFVPAVAEAPLDRQRLFVRYFTGILIDLVVLNLFAEYSDKVFVDTFTTSLFAAVVLQLLLQGTIAVEHRVMEYFSDRVGTAAKFLKYFCAWLVLFGSKFVILEALAFLFEKDLQFHGIWHGLITLIVVIVVMLAAEEAVVRLYRALGRRS